jgi:hypothetical protein
VRRCTERNELSGAAGLDGQEAKTDNSVVYISGSRPM